MAEGIDFEAQIKEDKAIASRLEQIDKKIIVMSGKGGVGKTTVTINLANALVASGKKVGVLDTDLTGPNVAKMLGCEEGTLISNDEGKSFEPFEVKPGLKVMSLAFAIRDGEPVVWRGPMKSAAIRQFLSQCNWGVLDYLLIDSPPGTGDEQLSTIQAVKNMTGSIIVTTPQEVAIQDARRSVSFSNALKVPVLGVIENMSGLICPHCGEEIDIFGRGGGEKMSEKMQVNFLGAIPFEVNVRKSEDGGRSILSALPDSPVTRAFQSLADKLNAE